MFDESSLKQTKVMIEASFCGFHEQAIRHTLFYHALCFTFDKQNRLSRHSSGLTSHR
jgi:hypothetical protein